MPVGDSTPIRPNSAVTRPLSAMVPAARPMSAAAGMSPAKVKRSNYHVRLLGKQDQPQPQKGGVAPAPRFGDGSVAQGAGGFMPSHLGSKLRFDEGSSRESSVVSSNSFTQHRIAGPATAAARLKPLEKGVASPLASWGGAKENLVKASVFPNLKSLRSEDDVMSAIAHDRGDLHARAWGESTDRHDADVASLERAAQAHLRVGSVGRNSDQLSTVASPLALGPGGSPLQSYGSPSVVHRGVAPPRLTFSSYSQFLHGAGPAGSTQHSDGPILDATQDTTITQHATYRFNTDYVEVASLGRGNFGSVLLCKDRSTGELVAVKRLGPLRGHHDEKLYTKELTILTCVRGRSRHVVHLLGAFIDGVVPNPARGLRGAGHATGHIVMQMCPNGTLTEALQWRRERGSQWSEAEIVTFVAEMAEALHTIHSHDIAHGDFKPDNILLDTDMRYVLTDFGVAQFIDPATGRPVAGRATGAVTKHHHPAASEWQCQDSRLPSQLRSEGTRHSSSVRHSATAVLFASQDEPLHQTFGGPTGLVAPLVTTDRSESVAYSLNTQASQDEGDSRYLSPDMINGKTNYFAGDVFALGVTMFEMLTGEPAPRNGSLHVDLRSGDHMQLLRRFPALSSGTYSTGLLDLCFRMLCVDPTASMTSFDVLRHPCLTASCAIAVQHAIDEVTQPLPNQQWRPFPRVARTDVGHHPISPLHTDSSPLQSEARTIDGTPLGRNGRDWGTRSPTEVPTTGLRRPRDADDSPPEKAVGTPLPVDHASTPDGDTPVPAVAFDSDREQDSKDAHRLRQRDATLQIMLHPQFVNMRYAAAQLVVAEALLRTQIPLRTSASA